MPEDETDFEADEDPEVRREAEETSQCDEEGLHLRFFLGRARGPRFKETALRDEDVFQQGARREPCNVLIFWNEMTTKLSALSSSLKLRQDGSPSRRDNEWVRNLKRDVAQHIENAPVSMTERLFRGMEPWPAWRGALRALDDDKEAETWHKKAAEVRRRAKGAAMARASKEYLEWVDEQEKTYDKTLYRITKPPPLAKNSAVIGVWHKGIVTEPLEIAAHQRYMWQGYWQARPQELREAVNMAKEVKLRASKERWANPTIEAVDDALCSFNEDTALGLDGLGPRFMKKLPRKGREQLAELIGESARKLAWPWQCLANLAILLDKPADETRAVFLNIFFFRLIVRLQRGQTREWSKERSKYWDHALANSSALRSAVMQALAVDLAELGGKSWALILYDLEKFYDSLSLAILLGESLKREYSPTLLYMLFLCYTGPRIIRVGRCSAEPIQPSGSIVAGCGEAGNMAKCMIYDLVDRLHQGRCKDPARSRMRLWRCAWMISSISPKKMWRKTW